MKSSPSPVRIIRHGSLKLHLTDGVTAEEVVQAMRTPGEMLHTSAKSRTTRVGDWVVKTSLANKGSGLLKHTFRRNRYRRGWEAAFRLQEHGAPIPTPRAFSTPTQQQC